MAGKFIAMSTKRTGKRKRNKHSMLDTAAKNAPLSREELQEAITVTLAKIEKIKQQINNETDPKGIRKLIRMKRELQYLQLWHVDHLKQFEK